MKRFKNFILLLVFSVLLVGCGNDKEELVTTDVDYEISNVSESHIGAAKRFGYDVVVNEEVTEDDLINISREVIELAKEETPFNAIVVGFYDYPEYIDYGYILGKVEYAPRGAWEDASNVKTGDYSTMEYVDKLSPKNDWSKRLTKEEAIIWRAWFDNNQNKWENIDPNDMDDMPDDDETTAEIAAEFNISEEEVNNILDKQSSWAFQSKE